MKTPVRAKKHGNPEPIRRKWESSRNQYSVGPLSWIELGLADSEAMQLREIRKELYNNPEQVDLAHTAHYLLQHAMAHFDKFKDHVYSTVNYYKAEGFIDSRQFFQSKFAWDMRMRIESQIRAEEKAAARAEARAERRRKKGGC